MEWISVLVRMPPLNKRVLAWCENVRCCMERKSCEVLRLVEWYKLPLKEEAELNKPRLVWVEKDDEVREGFDYMVTHWMPLPEQPSGKQYAYRYGYSEDLRGFRVYEHELELVRNRREYEQA